jgi:recombinational DNA repair protein (RecF pathway)
LKEVLIKSAVPTGQTKISNMAVVLAALELLDNVCYAASPDVIVVEVALDFLHCQPASDPLFFFLAFELKLLGALGAHPDFSSCMRCGGDVVEGAFDPEEGMSTCKAHSRESIPHLQPLYKELIDLLVTCSRTPLRELREMEVDQPLRKDLGKLIHWTYTFHVQGYVLPESLKLL